MCDFTVSVAFCCKAGGNIIALVKQLIMYFFSVTWGDAAFTI